MSYHYLFKFIVIGDKAVGKSSICNAIINKHFSDYLGPTIGVEYVAEYFTVQDVTIKCQFWDISGDSSYSEITNSYLQDNIGVLLVFDKSNKNSFTNIKKWIKLLGDKINSVILLIGNKSDKTDIQVTNYEASLFALNHKYEYIDTSAKTGENINQSINLLISKILGETDLNKPHPGIKLGYKKDSPVITENKRHCCFTMCKLFN